MHDKITSHITQHKNFGRRNLGMSKFVSLFNITDERYFTIPGTADANVPCLCSPQYSVLPTETFQTIKNVKNSQAQQQQ